MAEYLISLYSFVKDAHEDSNSNNEKFILSFEQYTDNLFEIIQLDLFHLTRMNGKT